MFSFLTYEGEFLDADHRTKFQFCNIQAIL
ncbi:hypothetical protein TH47_07175 [Thalassospira sp. MCCC 1A02803]|nr:hypothetical protein TH47_07175 [Thalassospira sp. MCCC 1A02803]